MTLTTREARILRAFPEHEWIRHMDVRKQAAMDTATCGNLLKTLRVRKLIVGDLLARGHGNGSGRPCTVYQLTDLGRSVRASLSRQEAA